MIRPLVDFVTPTLGRDTLVRTKRSIQAQTDPSWRGNIAWDARAMSREYWRVEGETHLTGRFLNTYDGETSSAGLLRNLAIRHTTCPFVAFVDDDDTVHPEYVASLRKIVDDDHGVDVVIFGMEYPDGTVLPREEKIEYANVGINFAVRAEYLLDRDESKGEGVRFIAEDLSQWGPENNEDIRFLLDIEELGAKVAFCPDVRYYVRQAPQTN